MCCINIPLSQVSLSDQNQNTDFVCWLWYTKVKTWAVNTSGNVATQHTTLSAATSMHSEVYLMYEFGLSTFSSHFIKGYENATILHIGMLDIMIVTQKLNLTQWSLECELLTCMKCLYCQGAIPSLCLTVIGLGVKSMVGSSIRWAITIWTAIMHSICTLLSYIFFNLSLLIFVLYGNLPH